MRALNTRLPFVEEDDREEYMKDFIDKTKQSKLVKLVNDEKTKKETIHASVNMVTGIISKES